MSNEETRKMNPTPWLIACLLLVTPLSQATPPATAKLVPALGWEVKKQGGFPVSLASDPAGDIWVGTEGNGLWKYDAAKKDWTQFTTKDGLGDDCVYALAFDHQNRVWAGHLNHGVSVYNGDKWKNYGLIDGPIGDRVFAIAISPKDGDVWIATDMGLARYSEKRQDWDYYSRASGLPSDQIQGIAFGSGNLYAAAQCNGFAVAGSDDNYTKWQSLSGPESIPRAAWGNGSSALINGLSVIQGHILFELAEITPTGVAFLNYDSNTHRPYAPSPWSIVHGKDWQDHTAGPYQAAPGDKGQLTLPAEDWATAITADRSDVWAGYRKSGVECRSQQDPMVPALLANIDKPGTVLIRAILTRTGQPPLFAGYDELTGGLLTLNDMPWPASKPATSGTNTDAAPPNLPAPVPPPGLDDGKVLAARLGQMTQQLEPGEAYYLADDWRTEGDWVGRYGSGYAKLCGMAQNGDQDYPLLPGYEVSIELGPHHEASAASPVWHHNKDGTDDLRSLYDPTLGHRRDAEDNDVSYESKTYPESYDGPDLWVRTKVPDGVHCLSLYFVNNDAHTAGDNKYRDYDVQVLSGDSDDNKVQTSAPLARTRVTDFWGGVYKQFLVCGPASSVVRIGRNRSFVTKLQGVFLDPISPPDSPGSLPGFDAAPYSIPDEPENFHPMPLAEAAVNLWSQLDDALLVRGAVALQMPFRIWCYRAAIAGQAPAEILERWRWQIGIWTPEDRKKFDDAMKAAHDAVK